MKWKDGYGPACLRGRPLVMGIPSVGGVGQLASELCASSCKLERVATHCGDGLAPVVGHAGADGLCAPCEVYAKEDAPFGVMVVRSAVSSHHANRFLDASIRLLEESECSAVILLSGLPASEKRLVAESPFRFASDDWPTSFDFTDDGPSDALRLSETECGHAGLAYKIHRECARRNIPRLSIFKYCYEGDNAPDAIDLALRLNRCVRFLPEGNADPLSHISIPVSWKFPFGNRPPMSIY